MRAREFGRTGRSVSEIGFGSWAIGSAWGHVDDGDALAALHEALDSGVTFIDTADVYGDGRSEQLIARVLKERGGERPYVATKTGRRLPQQTVAGYSFETMAGFIERSLTNLAVDTLDLVQLHCPPTDLYYHPEVFGALDRLVEQGKIRLYGVSVERVEEALKAIEYPGVQSVQIIFNIVRQRPADLFFARAQERGVGILARLPLSSGLLTGKISKASTFAADDHRLFNREGASFDKGETFSGLDFDLQLSLVEQITPLVPEGMTLAQMALRWILDFPAITTAIPGGRRPSQIEENARASDLPPLSPALRAQLDALYQQHAKPRVHHLW